MVFAVLKPILALALMIQGFILMAYSPIECEEFGNCSIFVKVYCEKREDGSGPLWEENDSLANEWGLVAVVVGFAARGRRAAVGVCDEGAAGGCGVCEEGVAPPRARG